jgi:hypothetical protein
MKIRIKPDILSGAALMVVLRSTLKLSGLAQPLPTTATPMPAMAITVSAIFLNIFAAPHGKTVALIVA